ncbi:MAG TPA: hypothetical protein QF646_03530 [Candidatus Poseidoniales archaeon]|nr:hypothetical protein [Candidatus Poseidoniales archaeon]
MNAKDLTLMFTIILVSLYVTGVTFILIGQHEAIVMGPLLAIILFVTALVAKRMRNTPRKRKKITPPVSRNAGKKLIRREDPPKKRERDPNLPVGWTKEQFEQYGHISTIGPDDDL